MSLHLRLQWQRGMPHALFPRLTTSPLIKRSVNLALGERRGSKKISQSNYQISKKVMEKKFEKCFEKEV